jgi:cytoskeletal protein RodZ
MGKPKSNSKAGKRRLGLLFRRMSPSMEQRLRNKFVLTALLSLFIIVVLIIAFLNILNFVQIRSRADRLIEVLYENDGSFPPPEENDTRPQVPGSRRSPPGSCS